MISSGRSDADGSDTRAQHSADTMANAMHADVVLKNGTVHTQDTDQPQARSIAVADGRVASLDDAESAIGPHTRVIDLEERAVVPGFVDAHMHFGSFALARQQVDLDAAESLEQ